MDYRLALLLHTFHGLKLSPDDLEGLWSLGDSHILDVEEVVRHIVSAPAHEYLRDCRDWLDRSRRIFEASSEDGVRWSFPGQSDYPVAWNSLSRRPLLFSYKGQPVWLHKPLLSVVGSRTPMSDTSLWLQKELVAAFRDCDLGVVSGGARGVDQWAHRLAIAAGRPTICIFPSGLGNPYPSGSESLWESILLADGCLLSTFAWREPMRKCLFPIRNRWIAGMSSLTFVAEANRRSGSHLTAGLAVEEGREVATLPVSAYSGQGLANLDLLMDGAHLVRNSADLVSLVQRYVQPLFLSPSLTQSVYGYA